MKSHFNKFISLIAFSLSHPIFAQEGSAAGSTREVNPIASFAPFIIIFVIFYFLMIRPQKKKIQQEQAMLGAIVKGDEIFTKSGLIGTITGMTDKIITLEVAAGVKLKVIRSQIGGLTKQLFENNNSSPSNSGKLIKQ